MTLKRRRKKMATRITDPIIMGMKKAEAKLTTVKVNGSKLTGAETPEIKPTQIEVFACSLKRKTPQIWTSNLFDIEISDSKANRN